MVVSDKTSPEVSPDPRRHSSLGIHSTEDHKGPGASLLLLALPLFCCGGPLIFGLLAAIGAVVFGTVIGVILLVIAVVVVVYYRRRDTSCCEQTNVPVKKVWRS